MRSLDGDSTKKFIRIALNALGIVGAFIALAFWGLHALGLLGKLGLGLSLVGFGCLILLFLSLRKSFNLLLESHTDEISRYQSELENERAKLESTVSRLGEMTAHEEELQEALDFAENQKAMLDHASRRFQSLITGLPVGCMTFDAEGTIMEWNPAMGEIFGHQAFQAILNSAVSILQGQGREEELVSKINKVCEDGEATDFEWTFHQGDVTKTAHMFWFPLRDPNGKAIGGIGCAVDITKEKIREQELVQMSRMQSAILNSAEYAIVACSPDGTVSNMNLASLQLLGIEEFNPEQGLNILSFYCPDELELVAAEYEAEKGDLLFGLDVLLESEVIKKEKADEWLFVRTDGSLFDSRTSLTPLVDETGIVHGYVLIFSDITEEKQTKERMKLLSLVASGAKNSVLVCDASSAILYSNPAFEVLSGYDSEEVYGKSPFDFMFCEVSDTETRKKLVESVRCSEAISEDVIQIRRDGTLYWVRNSITPIFDTNGICQNIVWIQEDISSRKLAEEETRQANERTISVLESIHDNFLSIDFDEQVTYINKSASLVLGNTVENLIGKNVWIPCCGSDWLPVKRMVEQTLEDQQVRSGELWFTGISRHFEFRVYPSNTGVSIFFQDISDRIEIQTELQERMAELVETKVVLEMQQEELKKANQVLHNLATTDGLTGLSNHKAFQEFLENQFQLAKATGQELTVALMDVDKFKMFNDSFGHLAGDDVLKNVAKILSSVVKAPHMVARYGGEEFVIVLEGLDEVESLALIEEARYELEGAKWPHRQVTASFGVAFYDSSIESRQDLIERADQALYHSKNKSRNRVTSWCWLGDERNSNNEQPAA